MRDGRLPRAVTLLLATLVLIAVGRIVSTYFVFPQAYDEPAHIACGMEWLDKGTFTLEVLHPPLPRVAVALGPYLAGVRLPEVQMVHDKDGTDWYDIYPAGTEILNAGGRYFRNLTLARLGQLPFFLIAVAVVFIWARQLYGPWPALFAVLLFTTIPPILAFAGLSYVDLSLGALLPVALFAFTRWLQAPTLGRSAVLGLAVGLSVIANFPALLFLPICFVTILICWWRFGGKEKSSSLLHEWRPVIKNVVCVLVVAFVVIWGGYRFSVKPLNQVFAKPAKDVEMLPVPRVVKRLALQVVRLNPPLPAVGFLKGVAAAWTFNKISPASYALGRVRRGGFWYFYWVVVGVKTPLALLLLAAGGIGLALFPSKRDWRVMAPAASLLAILAVVMVVKVNLGIRHVLFIYPLMSVTAIGFALFLWEKRTTWPKLVGFTLVGLFGWQIVSSAVAHPDYIAYFNEIAWGHKDDYLLFGCDLDCGQDLWRLARTLKTRGITHLSLKVATSADLSRMDLPPFHELEPNEKATGWVAVSLLFIRTGRALWNAGDQRGWDWLNAYQPVECVGNTIRLYYIPEGPGGNAPRTPSAANKRSFVPLSTY